MPSAISVVTLLTDFGERDYFVASMKGVILNINPQARIVDLASGRAPAGGRGGLSAEILLSLLPGRDGPCRGRGPRSRERTSSAAGDQLPVLFCGTGQWRAHRCSSGRAVGRGARDRE